MKKIEIFTKKIHLHDFLQKTRIENAKRIHIGRKGKTTYSVKLIK